MGGNSSTLTSCYASGSVTGTDTVGGLVGQNLGTITSCFWDTQTSGQATSDGGTGKTTAQMKTKSTFTNASWDFVGETINGTEDIWTINVGVSYPELVQQSTCDVPSEPTGISATKNTYTDHIRVTWNSVSGATAYEVWKNTSNNSNTASQIPSDKTSPYDDFDVTAGTTYYYWVTAKNICGTSGFSSSDYGLISSTQKTVHAGSIVGWGESFGKAPAGNNFIAIAAGQRQYAALKSDGSIVCWGNNIKSPQGKNFIAVSGETNGHFLALKSDGSIIGWGNNGNGQATPPPGNDFIAIATGAFNSLALKSDGSIIEWGSSIGNPPSGINFKAIAAGGAHALALKSDGSIVGWGYNNYGQATPPAGNDFIAIAARGYHSLALKSDGSIVGWGDSIVGSPPSGNDFKAIAAGESHALALKSDGSIVGWGDNSYGQATPPAGNNFIAIAAEVWHSLAIADFKINKCTVKLSKYARQDNISASGVFGANTNEVENANEIYVEIRSIIDDYKVYNESIVFDSTSIKNGKFAYKHKISKGEPGAITSLSIDMNKHLFSLTAANIDLTGLSCPFIVKIEIGSYVAVGQVDEDVVNGKTPIPIQLMSGYADYLRIDTIKPKWTSTYATDSLSIKGGIAFKNQPYSMADVIFNLDGQTFTIPANSFRSKGKSGLVYVCKNVKVMEGGTANATFDFSKCTFVINIKNMELNIQNTKFDLILTMGSFNESVKVDLGG